MIRSKININNQKLRHLFVFCIVGFCGFLTACANQTNSLEKPAAFAESKVESKTVSKVDLNVSTTLGYAKESLPRGGGYKKVGQPYKVGDQWYHPELNKEYSETGSASWYGDKFHGSRTANGEIYDMQHLTAAHPTMPLPSYARVTNTTNGSSVIVRVNDRGPFAKNRIIDLSHRAADMLGYKSDGVAEVKVEYVGPAPLEGQDDAFLLASYNSGNTNTPNLLALAPQEPVNSSSFYVNPSDQLEIIKQIEARAELSQSLTMAYEQ